MQYTKTYFTLILIVIREESFRDHISKDNTTTHVGASFITTFLLERRNASHDKVTLSVNKPTTYYASHKMTPEHRQKNNNSQFILP